jgi:hypothetical protein
MDAVENSAGPRSSPSYRELVARYGSSERPGKTEIEISRSGCDYIYLERQIPATPGGWFGVTIDKDGKVTDFMPGV